MEINFGNPGHGGLEAPPATLGGSGTRQTAHGFLLLCEGKWDFLNIPFSKQQFGDTDVTESPQ